MAGDLRRRVRVSPRLLLAFTNAAWAVASLLRAIEQRLNIARGKGVPHARRDGAAQNPEEGSVSLALQDGLPVHRRGGAAEAAGDHRRGGDGEFPAVSQLSRPAARAAAGVLR